MDMVAIMSIGAVVGSIVVLVFLVTRVLKLINQDPEKK